MKILLVEDDDGIREMISTVLARVAIEYDTAIEGRTALQMLRRKSYSALVLDLMLPGGNGFEVLHELRAVSPAMLKRTIVITAASESTLLDFDRKQVFAMLRKPFDLQNLLQTLEQCVAPSSAHPETPSRSYSLRSIR